MVQRATNYQTTSTIGLRLLMVVVNGNGNGCRSGYEYRGHGYRGHEDVLGHGGTDK